MADPEEITVDSYSRLIGVLRDDAYNAHAVYLSPEMFEKSRRSKRKREPHGFKIKQYFSESEGNSFLGINYLELISKGSFARIYRAYQLEEEKRGEETRYKVGDSLTVVRKIANGHESDQVYGNRYNKFFGEKGRCRGKKSTYQVMPQYGADLFYWLFIGSKVKKNGEMTHEHISEDEVLESYHPPITCLRGREDFFGDKNDIPARLNEMGKSFNALGFSGRVDLIIKIIEELQRIHTGSPPLLHGDVKPENILVQLGKKSDGEVYVVSVRIVDPDSVKEMDENGRAPIDKHQGTLFFLPPEALNSCEYGTSAYDLFSTAPLFAEILGGDDQEIYQERWLYEGMQDFYKKIEQAKFKELENLHSEFFESIPSLEALSNEEDKAFLFRQCLLARTKREMREVFQKGYNFDSILPKGFIDSPIWIDKREGIKGRVLSVLNLLQNIDPERRPTSDELLEFFKTLKAGALIIEDKATGTDCYDLPISLTEDDDRRSSTDRKRIGLHC